MMDSLVRSLNQRELKFVTLDQRTVNCATPD